MADINDIIIRTAKVYLDGTPSNPGLPPELVDLAIDQDEFETNGYTSHVFLTDNNLNGYKYTGSHWQDGQGVQSPEGDYYAHYDSPEQSAGEKVDWIYRRIDDGIFPEDLTTITSTTQYAMLLKKAGWYGASESVYESGLDRWYQDFVSEIQDIPAAVEANPGKAILIFAGIAAVIYLIAKQ